MPVNSFDNYPMSWKPLLGRQGKSLYQELSSQLERDIKNGTLRPGTMLPPQRELADYLDINLSTVTRAFKICEQKGLICGATGRGTYVTSDTENSGILLATNAQEKCIEMGAIMPDNTKNQIVIKEMQKILQEPGAYNLLQYGILEDNYLKKKAAAEWIEKGNFKTDPNQILFAAGGQNAIAAIFGSLFQCGDKIGTTSVIYPGVKTVANMLSIQLVPIFEPTKQMDQESIEKICKTEGLKGFYIISDYQNPTTETLSVEQRKSIAEISRKWNLIVIEDGINTLLSHEPLPPIAHFAPENTIYIASVSKTISPGLRVAFLSTPKSYYNELSIGIYNMNIMVSPLLVETVVRLINSKQADEILHLRKEETKKRNTYIDTILKDYEVLGDEYCNFRWLILPEGFVGESFELSAKNAGVKLYCAERFRVGNSRIPHAVRIAVTAEPKEANFEKGIHIIKKLLEAKPEFTYF